MCLRRKMKDEKSLFYAFYTLYCIKKYVFCAIDLLN